MPKPLFMWAGGKSKLLAKYSDLFPVNGTFTSFAEPFMGGAALMGKVAELYPGTHMEGGDVNEELIRLYSNIRDSHETLLEKAKEKEAVWLAEKEKSKRKDFFYKAREEYWGMPEGESANAMLLFLMKTAFNGIWQTCKASNGRFGTPVGLANQKVPFIENEKYAEWAALLSGAELHSGGYQTWEPKEGAWIFCDPPYRDSFTSYGTVFGDEEQKKLVEWCRRQAVERKCLVWLANREANDNFFEEVAHDAELHKFPIVYTAGRRLKTEDGFEAKKAIDLLMIWDGRDSN